MRFMIGSMIAFTIGFFVAIVNQMVRDSIGPKISDMIFLIGLVIMAGSFICLVVIINYFPTINLSIFN